MTFILQDVNLHAGWLKNKATKMNKIDEIIYNPVYKKVWWRVKHK